MKNKKLTFFTVFMIAAIMLLSLFATACTRSVEEIDDGAIVKDDMIYSTEGKGENTITVSFAEAGFGRLWIVEIGKQFVRENPQYTIILDGDSQVSTSVATKLESGSNLSDIYMPLAINWQEFALRGWLEDLGDLYDTKPDGENGKTIREKLTGSFKSYGDVSVGGKTSSYALPWNENITGIAYNSKMFSQYGWDVPETVDELIALCEQILLDTNGKIAPFVYPGQTGGYFDFLGTTWWAQSAGIEGFNKFFSFDSLEVYNPNIQPSLGKKDALTAFNSLFGKGVTKYSLAKSMSKNHITAQMDFVNGNAAMIPNASWLETEIKDSMDSDFEMKLMRVPYLSTAQKNQEGGYKKISYAATPDFIIIPKQSKNIESAKKFLSFMSRDDMLKLYTKKTSTPRPFEYNIDEIKDELSEFGKSCLEIWSTSESFFDTSKSLLYYKGFAKKFVTISPYASLVYGDTTPAKFCNEEYLTAQQKWDTWVSDAGIK